MGAWLRGVHPWVRARGCGFGWGCVFVRGECTSRCVGCLTACFCGCGGWVSSDGPPSACSKFALTYGDVNLLPRE